MRIVSLFAAMLLISSNAASLFSRESTAKAQADKELTGVIENTAYYKNYPVHVVDLHFHPSDGWENVGPVGKRFILQELPSWLPTAVKTLGVKLASSLINSPYGQLGIKGECQRSGITFCGLFATYAPETWGVVSNEFIVDSLNDPGNPTNTLGSKMFFGLASIDINDWQRTKISKLNGLEDALQHKLIKGIKMAHIHNTIPLDSSGYEEIYQLASKYKVPVYHHVGSSPLRKLEDFSTQREKDTYLRSYNPNRLESIIEAYPSVAFVLGHMGYDFNKEGFDFTDDSIELAKKYHNVFLEVSAIGRPVFDDSGLVLDYAFDRLKANGLTHKVIYGSDGPIYPGATKAYLNSVLRSMSRMEYSLLEAQSVLFYNANALFKVY